LFVIASLLFCHRERSAAICLSALLVILNAIVRHRERSAAICLLALFSHPERDLCHPERSEGSFYFPVLAWSPDHARPVTARSPIQTNKQET